MHSWERLTFEAMNVELPDNVSGSWNKRVRLAIQEMLARETENGAIEGLLITSIEWDGDKVTILLSDGTRRVSPSLTGPKGYSPEKGVDYSDGEDGKSPSHDWKDTSLAFQNPDGSWGNYVNLRGPQGKSAITYTSSGQVNTKRFTEKVTSDSNGLFSISTAVAGFTEVYSVHVTAVPNTTLSNNTSAPDARCLSVSNNQVSGVVLRGRASIILSSSSNTAYTEGATVYITVEGI